jgi:hypothetical protein
MGDILILSASYVVGDQDIDVTSYVTTQQGANYGAINFPVQQMDDDLRKKNMVVLEKDADPLKLTPPRLTINYTDTAGAYHSVAKKLGEVVDIGERSSFGKFVQKPGDVLYDVGLTAAKGQFLFVFVLSWALVVMWTYKQWDFLQGAYNDNLITGTVNDSFGLLGKYVGIVIFYLFDYGAILGKPFGSFFPGAAAGWPIKFIFSLFSALTPVSSFFLNFLIWFTLVQSLLPK